MTLNQVFERSVQQFPEHIAIKGEGFSFTYKEFDELTANFARQLIAEGVTTGSYVGICLERSAEMLIGIFGILRAGAAYLPIDITHPQQRIKSLITIANLSIIVTTSNLTDYISELNCQAIVPFKTAVSRDESEPLPVVNENDTAYVLFTSGSTGTPKGVMIAHRSVVNLIAYIQKEYPLNPEDVVLLKSPYTFDGSVWELFGWILMGGTLFVAPKGDEKDPKKLWEIISNEKIAFLFFVPSMLQAFIEFHDFYKAGIITDSIKWVSVGGEVLPAPLVTEFYKVFDFSKAKLINVYGPTETTVYAITHLCLPTFSDNKIPLGKPVTNDYIYLLDENGKPVSDGAEGEVYIGGAGVGKGYLGNEELNTLKFVPDTFAKNGLMYRTGDMGKINEDGTFDFIGRKDYQVKLRGLRIELGEIEVALLKIQTIAAGVVSMGKDANSDDCLVAYIRVIKDEQRKYIQPYSLINLEDDSRLRSEISNWLPAYMIPTYFIVCQSFQLTTHGKIDRKSLPPIQDLLRNKNAEAYIPASSGEQKIVEIWQSTLGLNSIGANDDFFALGGHSLKAIQLISLVIREFGVEVPLNDFYQGITLHQMIEGIQQHRYLQAGKTITEWKAYPDNSDYPITPVQTEMWIMNNFDSTGLIHNIQIEFTLKGNPSIDKFIDAIKKTINNEEIFASEFKPVNGFPFQRIVQPAEVRIPITDLTIQAEQKKIAQYSALVEANGKTRFDTEKLPLYALQLIKWSTDEYRMLMAIHHLIFDGWSLYLFMKRISQNYNQEESPRSPWRNIDYAMFLQTPDRLDRIEKERVYWQKQLRDLPPRWLLPLRQDAQPHESGKYGERYWWTIDPPLSSTIDDFALQQRTTPFSVFMTAFQLSLAAGNQINDVVVGTPFANRNHEIVHQLIGYYTNMVSIRLHWNDEITAEQLVKQCSNQAIEAFSHATIPFGEVAKMKGKSSEIGSNPIYQSIMVLQNWPHDELNFSDFNLYQREIGNNTAKTDFLLNIEKQNDEYKCWLEFDTKLYDQQTAERLAKTISQSLLTITNNPKIQVKSLSVLLSSVINPESKFSCYVLGEGKLAAQCISILKQKNISVCGVITNDEWLRNQFNLKWFDPKELRRVQLDFKPVDYIFSINNSLILKPDFLKLAARGAINYHDAPLPRFAGMFATNWALLNACETHGVSWHVITDMIDAGDLLSTEMVKIMPQDNALTLNTRCFEAALISFGRLINDIVNNQLISKKQDLSHRSYFPLAMRPVHFGCFYPSMTRVEADRLIQATNFGSNFDNEFALPWLWVDSKLYIVAEAETIQKKGEKGRFEANENKVGFYCADGFIVLKTLYNLQLLLVDVKQEFSESCKMTSPEENQSRLAATFFTKAARFEPFWKKVFDQAEFIKWPFNSHEKNSFTETYHVSQEIVSSIKTLFPKNKPDEILTAAAVLLVLRLIDRNSGTLGLIPMDDSSGKLDYFSNWVPLSIETSSTMSVKDAMNSILISLTNTTEALSFVRSLRVRYPKLRADANHLPDIFLNKSGHHGKNEPGKINLIIQDASITISRPEQSNISGIDIFIRCLETFLYQLLSFPDTGYRFLPLMNNQEIIATLHAGNIASNLSDEFQDVIQLVTQKAKAFPDAVAIFDSGNSFSYHTFLNDIFKLSAYLSTKGIKNGAVVGIAMERNYCNLLSIMSVLYSGGCFIELDIKQPAKRLDFILKDAGVSILLTDEDSVISNLSLPHIVVSSFIENAQTTGDLPCSSCDPNSGAYIIYTSGSTGSPKGVVISRGNLSGFIKAASATYKIQSSDKILQFSNLSFDACIEEIFCCLCNGASLFLRTDNMLQPTELITFSIKHNISIWDLPTAFWRQLIHNTEYKESLDKLSLRLVIIGGEAVFPADILEWKIQPCKHQLINTYGPTETTVVALSHAIVKDEESMEVIPIGRPLPGYQAFVVDSQKQLVPAGIPGELLIAGNGVALGYLNRKEETEKAFIQVEIPLSGLHRCYCTGDMVYNDQQGVVYFLGRKDHQIKIRGFRIEPSEIEHQVLLFEGINSCIVIPESSAAGMRLIAFCTGKLKITQDLKSMLKERLPLYMIPHEIVFLESIPLTTNGKADIKSLLQLHRETGNEETEEANKPAGSTEEYLELVWKSILGIEKLGVNDDFFELGGHSLNAVSMMAQIKKEKGIHIPLASLIQHPTIRKFAMLLDCEKGKFQWNCLVPIRTEGSLCPLFLIHGAGLNVLFYQSLVKHLSPNRPIYAFQAAGLDGKRQLKNSIEAMAEEYVDELLKIQAKGPFLLMGFSLGGFIAIEMAQILLAKGHEVRFTGLIDSVAYLADFSNSRLEKTLIRSWSAAVKPFFNFWLYLNEPYESKSRFLSKKIKNLKLSITYFLNKTGIRKKSNPQGEIGELNSLSSKVLIFMNEALLNYKLKPANFHIDLFAAAKPTFYIYDRKMYGWSNFANKGITKHVLPGEHSLFFAAPHDKIFAKALEERLIELEQNSLK
jgi:amino acid adenylation domain-containing protein